MTWSRRGGDLFALDVFRRYDWGDGALFNGRLEGREVEVRYEMEQRHSDMVVQLDSDDGDYWGPCNDLICCRCWSGTNLRAYFISTSLPYNRGSS